MFQLLMILKIQPQMPSGFLTRMYDLIPPEDDDSHHKNRYMEGRYHIIPLHDACNKVLAKFLNYSVGTTPKDYLRVLFEALRSFHDTSSDFYAGKIKYGKISKQHGQFWYPTLTTKAFVYDPFFTSPVLKTYYDNLPEIGKDRDEREDSAVCYMKTTSKPDPFRKLPPELLMMILMHLPAQSIRQLKLASVAIVQLQLPGSFWKQKLKRDMPWLWDFPGQGTEQTQKDLDWLQIYKDIYIGSKGNGKSPFFNLANRNRIWRISEQIAPRFVKCQDEWKIAQEREREKLLALTSEKERRLWPHLDWL
jgi:hypothetical protein